MTGQNRRDAVIITVMERRTFIKAAGAAASLGAGADAFAQVRAAAVSVALVVDPADSIASAGPSKWAVQELLARLQARGVAGRMIPSISQAQLTERNLLQSWSADRQLAAPAVAKPTSDPRRSRVFFDFECHRQSGHRVLLALGPRHARVD